MRTSHLASAALLLLAALPCRAAVSCEDLIKLRLPGTTIKTAESIAGGDYVSPDKVTRSGMPAFCRVVASVSTGPDSDIGVEIWLPQKGWKRVFHGNGSGGFGGTFRFGYYGMETGVKRGYASATTDMGTAPADDMGGDPLIGHPQKWKDWGLLSTHAMTVAGKQITAAFYGNGPKRSYFTGCSTGGQQGLIEAQYYPADYDGIVAGAPVINRTWGHVAAVWNYQASHLPPAATLSDAKLALLHAAAVKACAGSGSGLASDPFIADPLMCKFDPVALQCNGADADTCLTAAEVNTARAYYSGPMSQLTEKPLYFGWLPGSETSPPGWQFIQTPPGKPLEPAFGGLFKWVYGADWDWRAFDFDRDMVRVDAELGAALNGATKADLGAFERRGGKLILYHGWADPLVSPLQTVAFYEKFAARAGGVKKAQSFARLFMAPGVGHCGGGEGPNRFFAIGSVPTPRGGDVFAAMTRWVEKGAAPTRLIATKYVDNAPAKGIAMQRPLCPYPQKAWYKGTGSQANAGSFVCGLQAPKR